ncbi:amidohydrolase family protein [bacterium]|nr:amidohydrolase family protein [bacterium]
MILRAAAVIADAEDTIFHPGAVRIGETGEREGIILEIGPAGEMLPAAGETVQDLGDLWLMPGLVQSHVHLNQTLFRGMAEERTLLAWLRERIWPLEAAHDKASVHASAREAIAEMLLGGTTAALTMETTRHTGAAMQAAAEMGFRARCGTALMDRPDAGMPPGMKRDGRRALEEQVALHREWMKRTRGLVGGCIAPRFVISCSDELLRESGEVADTEEIPWHSHVSENPEEVEAVRARSGLDNARFFDSLGLLSERSVLAHGVHLTEEERLLLAERGSTIAHCPSTNLKMASGMADTLALQHAGVHVTLGSDGAACNNRLDTFQEMRLAALLGHVKHGSDAIRAGDIFRWATANGARAMGLSDRLGELKPGMYADLIAVDPGLFPVPDREEDLAKELYGHLLYSLNSAHVRHVWVHGRQRVKHSILVEYDIDEIRAGYREQRIKVVSRAELG